MRKWYLQLPYKQRLFVYSEEDLLDFICKNPNSMIRCRVDFLSNEIGIRTNIIQMIYEIKEK